MPLTAQELDDALHAGLLATKWNPTRPFTFNRYALWMTSPVVVISDGNNRLRWVALAHDHRGHGFSRRQATQMRRAFARALTEERALKEASLESLILAIVNR